MTFQNFKRPLKLFEFESIFTATPAKVAQWQAVPKRHGDAQMPSYRRLNSILRTFSCYRFSLLCFLFPAILVVIPNLFDLGHEEESFAIIPPLQNANLFGKSGQI